MSNQAEYLAGTDPFKATQLLKIESVRLVPGTGRVEVTFTTVLTRKYRLLMSEALDDPRWTPVPTSADEQGELVFETYDGNDGSLTVYANANLSSMFFRVAVDS